MNLFKRNRKYCVLLLSALLILLVASCAPTSDSSAAIRKVTPAPSSTPEVEYGASLTEWEDATQDDSTESADNGENEQIADNEESELAADSDNNTDVVTTEDTDDASIGTPFELENVVYREILWDGLIPADFTGEAIMAKYQEELDSLESGSSEMSELYGKMQEEFNNAPVNEVLNEIEVRIPGFVTPLEYNGDLITEFLLVPNLGACIHVPPPPVNQTVLVKTAEGHGIKIEDSYNPIWVMGKIVTEGATTELATAGYNIQEAIIEPYTASGE